MSDPTTPEDCLRAAFKALLGGDRAERDRLCDLANKLHANEGRVRDLKPEDSLARN